MKFCEYDHVFDFSIENGESLPTYYLDLSKKSLTYNKISPSQKENVLFEFDEMKFLLMLRKKAVSLCECEEHQIIGRKEEAWLNEHDEKEFLDRNGCAPFSCVLNYEDVYSTNEVEIKIHSSMLIRKDISNTVPSYADDDAEM